MTERWVEEIRKLSELDVPDEVWERALRGSNDSSPGRRSRRWVAAAVAAVVFLGGGTVAWLAFAPGSNHQPVTHPTPSVDLASIPDEADVVCGEHGATTSTPLVRPQRDGIHVVFDNRAGYRRYLFQDPNGHGGLLHAGPNPAVTYTGPGHFWVGCVAPRGALAPGSQFYIRIQVVDPQGLFTPQELDCVPGRRGVRRRVGSATDLAAIVRTIPGVLPGDRVLRPGYPDEAYMVEPRVVIRGGRVVARITMFGPTGESPPPTSAEWKLWVDACPGSGIGTSGA
jgi:hypothetical protein